MAHVNNRYKGVPDFIYGTAFKDDETAALVETAIKCGFRAVDTAGNRPQYRESLVGQGISAAIESGVVRRPELYIQTKFSPFKAGRDPSRYPYDVKKAVPEQVKESVCSSLVNLNIDYIDCLVLHSLYPSMDDSLTAWRAMEELVPEMVTSLALSNVGVEALRQICDVARVKPVAVQNRFTSDTEEVPEADLPPGLPYPKVPYDRDVRTLCILQGVVYAPWGLLWGNPEILDDVSSPLQVISRETGITQQVVFYCALRGTRGCKYSILCGTTKEAKMQQVMQGMSAITRYVEQDTEQQRKWETAVGYLDQVINKS